MFRLLIIVCSIWVLAACDSEPEDTETTTDGAAATQDSGAAANVDEDVEAAGDAADDPDIVVPEERSLREMDVPEEEPAVKVELDPSQVIAGSPLQTQPHPDGALVDVLRVEIEGDRMVVALRYRNPGDQSLSVPVPRGAISYTLDGTAHQPLPDTVWPEGDVMNVEVGDEGLVRIKFDAPPEDTAAIDLAVGEIRFAGVPINWAE